MSKLRFITLFPVVFGILSSLLMSVMGAGKAILALRIYFFNAPLNESVPAPPNLDATDQAIVAVVESVDGFLISIALLVFSIGVYNLFIAKPSESLYTEDRVFQIRSVGRLKQVLMEVIMVILTVLFLKELLLNEGELYWEMLVIPSAVALVALALKWVNWRDD